MKHHSLTRSLWLAVALSLGTLSAVRADSGRMLPRDMPASYTQECAACHAGADRGDYDDDKLQFPAGMSASQRLAWHD